MPAESQKQPQKLTERQKQLIIKFYPIMDRASLSELTGATPEQISYYSSIAELEKIVEAEMTFDEIGEELGMSRPTVMKHYNNGMRKMLEIIESDPRLSEEFAEYISRQVEKEN